jgi:type II secretory pathway component GspD/PulD (secretin)
MWGLLAAALVVLAQGIPVTRLAGGAPGPSDPQTTPTQRPSPPGLPVTQIDPGSAAATLDSQRRLSLSFANPRPIQEVLQLVVAGTPYSVAIDSDAAGSFRGELKQLTLREALFALLTPLGLGFQLEGTVIRVTHGRTETRTFDLNLLAVQRGLTRTAGGPNATLSTTMAPEDAFAAVADGVRSLLSPNGTVHVDRRAGLAQVTDDPERLDRVAQYLEAVQARSGRQVRLQARILEVTLKDAAAIDWRAVRDKLSLPRDAPEAGLAADPAALQAALADQGDVRVLSAPDVTAINNEPALIRAGTPGVSSLTLSVVAQIGADGIVQLSVSQVWEEQPAGQKLPQVAEADSVARVRDGRTVLIAGLLRPAPAIAVPGTGGPSTRSMQTELVVLVRATSVTPGTR